MEGTNAEVLVKSEKISQKKKIRLVWAISILLIIATMVSFIVDYSSYKKGQEFGLTSAILASEIDGSSWVNKNDSYAEQCKDIYYTLNSHTYDITLHGKWFDASDVRKAEDAMRSAFRKLMESAGYDRYSSYNIADWFKYTNFTEYFLDIIGIQASRFAAILLLFSRLFLQFWLIERQKKNSWYTWILFCVELILKSQSSWFSKILTMLTLERTL